MDCKGLKSNIYKLLSIWMVFLIIFLIVGCEKAIPQDVNTPSPSLTFDQNEDISLPNLPSHIQEFHEHPTLSAENQAPLLIITWFSRPYPKFFHVLLLWEDGVVINYREVPDWAVQARRMAKLNPNELQMGKSLLHNLMKVQAPTTGNGSEIIAFSFKIQEDNHVFTCTEIECPSEVQDLFEIAEQAFKRDAPAYGLMPNPFKNKD